MTPKAPKKAAKKGSAKRRPLLRNVRIGRTWYGPSHGNATGYPEGEHPAKWFTPDERLS